MPPADLVVLALLAIATLRGLLLGLLREVSSIAGLVAACLAVRFFAGPAADWLRAETGEALGPVSALIVSALGLGVGALLLAALLGRVLRRGARVAGVGWLDRFGGGVLGCAEGALAAGLLLALALAVVGSAHPLVEGSRAVAALEQLEQLARRDGGPLPPVAAPPEERQL